MPWRAQTPRVTFSNRAWRSERAAWNRLIHAVFVEHLGLLLGTTGNFTSLPPSGASSGTNGASGWNIGVAIDLQQPFKKEDPADGDDITSLTSSQFEDRTHKPYVAACVAATTWSATTRKAGADSECASYA